MVEKKNTKINQEKTKIPNFFVGFSFIAGVTLAAFTYQNEVDSGIKIPTVKYSSNVSYEEENIDKPLINEPPKIQETQPQQEINLDNDIVVVENKNQEVKETVIETIEVVEDPIIVDIVEPVVEFPDVEAIFMGGEEMMSKWMQENLTYPEISMENGDQGKVYLKFVVEKDGSITNVEIIKGVTRDLDNEAKRLIRNMPKWTPGETKGIKVRSSFTMPINFELN